MQAIIKTGGKQYTVKEGEIFDIDKVTGEAGHSIIFDQVLCIVGEEAKIGKPLVDGAKVEAQIVSQFKDKKVIIFKSRRRKDSKLKKGFRRHLTKVKVTKILV